MNSSHYTTCIEANSDLHTIVTIHIEGSNKIDSRKREGGAPVTRKVGSGGGGSAL